MRAALLLSTLGLLGASAALAAERPTLAYTVEVGGGSWEPLDPDDRARAVEHAALEVLTRAGEVRLVAGATGGDHRLRIGARLLDEAETHTVTLVFEPGASGGLGSLQASDTVALGGRSRAEMLAALDASARVAAGRLAKVLGPALAAPDASTAEPPAGPVELPWQWAPVRVPRPSASRAATELRAKDPALRQAALRELTSLALGGASPRHALEQCVLDHPDEETRLGCLVALRPLARRLEPTRRVVIRAFLDDASGRVREEASDQMAYFAGASRDEAAQAWLTSLSRGRGAGPIAELGDLPNLDLALFGCLSGARGAFEPRAAQMSCIALVGPLDHARRLRLLGRFLKEQDPKSPYWLEGAGEQERSTGTAWERAVEAVLEHAPAWDPGLEDALWERWRRTSSHASMDILTSYAGQIPPSKRLTERLLQIVRTAGEPRALRALEKVGVRSAELRPHIRTELAEMASLGEHPKSITKRDLEQVVRALDGERAAR